VGPKLYNAVRLYIDGVRDGHLTAALDKYVADEFTEHSPGVADDRAGLAAALEPLVRHRRRMLRPLRGFEDGSKVFLHTVAMFGWRDVEQVRLDIFDTDDDDHLTEHWGVATPLRGHSRSGYSQVDGALWADDLDHTAENKEIVEAYVRECLIEGDHTRLSRYLAPDGYVDHDPDALCGLRDYRHFLEGPDVARYTDLRQVVGCGNLVATFSLCDDSITENCDATGDLFRVACGRIVEHWDVREAAAKPVAVTV
jgi:predicted SnoaL-like aldol condensation-catalyzing enzyme